MFMEKNQFETHLRASHPNTFNEDQLPAFMEMSESKVSMDNGGLCPLCKEQVPSLKKLRRHLGRHQEQLALFALPLSIHDENSDQDVDGSDRKSNDSNAAPEAEIDQESETQDVKTNDLQDEKDNEIYAEELPTSFNPFDSNFNFQAMPSRTSHPPPTTSRRNSTGLSPAYAGLPHPNVGLNIQGRIFPSQPLGNPWDAYARSRGLRSRNSRPALRDQPSTATLRPASSQVNLRDVVNTPQNMRPQASRIDLRHQSSRRRLNNQASTRTLQASDHAQPLRSPAANTALPAQTVARPPPRYTAEEIESFARDRVNNRRRERQPNINPIGTDPFRRASISTQAPTLDITVASAPASNNLNESGEEFDDYPAYEDSEEEEN